MKGNPYKMGKMATKSAMKMGKKSPMKAEGDPNKTDKPKDKSYLQKAYDKASQIGMGVRGVLSAMGDDEASQRRIYSGEDLDIGKAYRDARDKEKAHDDAATKKKAPTKMKGKPVKGADPSTKKGKKALIDNAMNAAEKTTLSKGTAAGMKKHFGGVNAGLADVKLAIRKAKAIEGNSSHVQNMRKVAKSRYPKQFR